MLRDPHEGSGARGSNSENSAQTESNQSEIVVFCGFGVLAGLGVGPP
jgi:hypothetical protein